MVCLKTEWGNMAEEDFVTRDMNTALMLEKYPEAAELLEEYGMICTGCLYADEETLEEALSAHCMDIDAVMDALNERIRTSRDRR